MGQLEQRARLIARNTEIRKKYDKLKAIRKNGARLYSEEYVISELSKKFFLSSRTIEDIIYLRTKYENLNND